MLRKKASPRPNGAAPQLRPTYGSRFFRDPIPSHEIPENSMEPAVAARIIRDELNLDGNPSLNLASFVTTWMEPEAEQLILDTLNKNFIDQDEYPYTQKIHERVINMVARLLNAPESERFVGAATVGSSEAIILGLLAHKRSWRNRRLAQGKSADRPNIVFGAAVHSCWEKFAQYFDVEARVAPLAEGRYTLSAQSAAERIDENTVAVGCVLGATFTGHADEIEAINDLLVNLKRDKGLEIPIHVDGAGGGFVAPFLYPDLLWDFRLERVRSINVSNHKYGLVFPGMGTLVFRDESDLPRDLVFHINYLGGEMSNYSLNFSRGGGMVMAQYYNFLRLGKKGYRQILENIAANARYLEERLGAEPRLELVSKGALVPMVVVRLRDETRYTVFHVAETIREKGWIVPAYTLPPNAGHVAVMRVVVKENFSRDMAEIFVKDFVRTLDKLEKSAPGLAERNCCGDALIC